MMKDAKRGLTLAHPAIYRIKVPGQLDANWSAWVGEMTIAVDSDGEDRPITTLTGAVDQAALQGLLRRLYSLGLPLLSVICIDHDQAIAQDDIPQKSYPFINESENEK